MSTSRRRVGLPPVDELRAMRAGAGLTPNELAEREAKLLVDPANSVIRFEVLGYYAHQADVASKTALRQHLVQLVQLAPDCKGVTRPPCIGLILGDKELCSKLGTVWSTRASDVDCPRPVLDVATDFFMIVDLCEAERVVRLALARHGGPSWIKRLGQIYKQRFESASNESKPQLGHEALACFEQALEIVRSKAQSLEVALREPEPDRQTSLLLLSHRAEQLRLLRLIAGLAHETGTLKLAESACRSLLRFASANPDFPDIDNAVHFGHTVAGLLSLQCTDVASALAHLRESALIFGSIETSSTGPSMKLARELVKLGHSTAVLEYLCLCDRFWLAGKDRLSRWMEQLRRNIEPDFGRETMRS